MTTIRSSSNAVLKRARAVLAGKDRASIALAGERLVRDAAEAGVALEVVLVAEDREELARELEAEGLPVRRVRPSLLDALSGLRAPPGVLALGERPPPASPDVLAAGPRSRLAVAAGVADPGNLGALARAAEATGCEALAVLPGGARPWSEKSLRGSMGSLLRVPVLEATDAGELARELARRGYRSLRAATCGGVPFDAYDWTGPIALWFPGETGEPPLALAAFEPVTIPMAGRVESLNVAVAAAVLLFAAARAQERGT